MGKASRTKVDASRREKIAAQRAAAARAEQRRRILIAGGAIVVVVAVVLTLVLIKVNKKNNPGTNTASNGPTGTALSAVVANVTSVPASTLDKVGDGDGAVTAKPIPVPGSPLTASGKPEMLYIGAEYCPFCAAERWAMIVALSRFGTFSGLSTIHSAAANGAGQTEPFPNTPSWTFYKSSYTSPYLTFTPVETETNIPDASNGFYTTLQTPTKDQQATLDKYDAPPYVQGNKGAIPFIDFGNKYIIAGASYNNNVLAGKNWSQIAAALHDPNSPIAKAVGGAANYMTAAICKLTGNQPATACTPTVQALENKL